SPATSSPTQRMGIVQPVIPNPQINIQDTAAIVVAVSECPERPNDPYRTIVSQLIGEEIRGNRSLLQVLKGTIQFLPHSCENWIGRLVLRNCQNACYKNKTEHTNAKSLHRNLCLLRVNFSPCLSAIATSDKPR